VIGNSHVCVAWCGLMEALHEARLLWSSQLAAAPRGATVEGWSTHTSGEKRTTISGPATYPIYPPRQPQSTSVGVSSHDGPQNGIMRVRKKRGVF